MMQMLTHIGLDLAIVAALLLCRRFVFMFALVKGRSMLSTLRDRDVLAVNRLVYHRRAPQRGEIVICRFPNRWLNRRLHLRQHFVKRVVAVPGDTIAMEDGVLLLNGEPVDEPYLDPLHTRFRRTMPERTMGPDAYFVMGDNRDGSHDSRSIGPLPRREIIGRVERVLFSPGPKKRRKRKPRRP